MDAQLKNAKPDLESAKEKFSLREDALERSNTVTQNELDGILKGFDKLTRNFMDFDIERQNLEKQINCLQNRCKELENELADERVKHIGLDSNNNEPATTITLRKEFRKVVAGLKNEQQKK